MIKIAICEDEKNIRNYLSALIRKQNTDCEIAEYVSAEAYLASGAEYDLLFLDIELGNSVSAADAQESGMNGMELARRIRSGMYAKQPVIVFVTGHETYVYEAFDVGAFQYLLKPVEEKKFTEVFVRAARQIAHRAGQKRRTLTIRHVNRNKTILLETIYYMESQNHKIVLHLKDGTLEYYGKIGELEETLQGQFFRIHKGYLINLSYVEEYNKTEVILANGEELMISKYRYKDFVREYLNFIAQNTV